MPRAAVLRLGRSLRRFAALRAADRSTLIQVAALHTIALGAVRCLSLSTVRTLLARLAPGGLHRRIPPDRVAWAVGAVTRILPIGATCLTRALVAEALLCRGGQDARLRIGVARDDSGRILGHAWVEACGQVVVGGDHRRYTPLSALDALAGTRALSRT